MQCKYCGKEYKTEAFLLKHESECKESMVGVPLEEDFMNPPIVEESSTSPTTTEKPVTHTIEITVNPVIDPPIPKKEFAYTSPRNFKRCQVV